MTMPGPAAPQGEILVVDDSAASRTLLGGILEKRGYRVRFARDGEEALRSVRTAPPDLILLDLILPGMDGYRLTRRLRREPDLPYIPIILITAISDPEGKVRGLEAGADDFIVKPPDEMDLLARMGALLRLKRSQAALLLEKGKTDLLYRVSRELSAERDLDTLLERILRLAVEAVDAGGGSVILVGEQGELRRRLSLHRSQAPPIHEEVWNRILQEGLAGWVLAYRQGVIVPETESDPRWLVMEGAYPQTRSAICVPLLHAGRAVGVLTLTHDEPHHFSADHLDLVNSISTQGAVIIQKAWAYEKEQRWARKLQLVGEVGREVTSILEPDSLLRQVAGLICRAFDYYHVDVGLLEGQELVFRGWGSGRSEAASVPPFRRALTDPGIASWAAAHGQPCLATDVREEPRYCLVPELPATVAEMAVPLQVGGETLGVLDVQSDVPGQLTAEDIPLLETLASQIAVALRNAQMYEEQRRLADRQTALYEVLRATGAHLDPLKIAHAAVEAVSRWTGWPKVTLFLPDETGTNLVVQAAAGALASAVGMRLSVAQGISGRAFRTAQTQHVPDVNVDPDYVPLAAGVCGALSVPLRSRRRVLGVLHIESDRPDSFHPEDVIWAESLGEAIALALENARRATELSILNEVGRALSAAVDLDELVETIYRQVGRLLDTTNFYIALYEAESDTWQTLLEAEEGKRMPPERQPAEAGLTGYIIRHKCPLLFHRQEEIDAFERDQAILPLGRPGRSYLGVPLIATDRVVGVMAIQSFEQDHLYSEEDQALFATIAAQAAGAIEKARLYGETERERGKLAAVLAGATDVVLVSDDAGRLLLLNPAAEQAFGVRAGEVVGRPLAEALPIPALVELFQRGVRGSPPAVAEIPLDEQRSLYASVSRVPEVGYVAVMQDISAFKRLERMKNDFVATVSHDLRAPLTSIHGYAELLMGMVEGTGRDLARRIRDISEQMAELIGDLLDLGRIEAGVEVVRRPCSLEDLAQEALRDIERQAELREVAVTSSIGRLPPVWGDPLLLRRVLDNLLGNALKYTPAGGRIAVRGRQEGDQVLLEVQDTGIGIPRDALPRLFSKFYRVKSLDTEGIPGTGLGLAIVKSIVELHGGKVWLESEPGKGSTFGFALPIGRADGSEERSLHP